MEKISWTDRVRNEEVLHRVKEERNIVHTIKRRKANWIGHIWRRNCLLKHVIEGKLEGRIEMTGRRGGRRKQLLDNLKENRSYWKLKEEALDRTQWRTRFGRGYGSVVRQTTERMNEFRPGDVVFPCPRIHTKISPGYSALCTPVLKLRRMNYIALSTDISNTNES
jgi:hypothetical protein